MSIGLFVLSKKIIPSSIKNQLNQNIMFNIFKKKSTNSVKKESNKFHEFSEEQKAAIVYSLILVATANGNYNDQKMGFMQMQADSMSLNMKGKIMLNQLEKKSEFAFSILEKFNSTQVQLYLPLLWSSLNLEGNPTDNEEKMVQTILDSSGIPTSTFKAINDKAKAIMSNLNK